ncbi:sulfate ABC transporter permease [Vibrio aquaticus]|uniref:Sulfate ABC transporter permease n=1 Tax=Vibrio aquaticus TaxID=2496559 RepID=A0A432D211_9VIBR|nr:sulfate ABC transporter permease [Vibrio aquaticus]RTZ17936.1 sulfate ABC transporter permease [Vibrio aquaticus]
MNKILTTMVLLGGYSGWSLGAIELGDNLSISGFGSGSYTESDHSSPLLVQRNIVDESCFDCDTTFGLQLDYFNSGFKASVQVVKRPQDNWDEPELEWAYVGYDWQDISVAAGRQRLPLFLASEYYYVGHAYTAARPPEVYDSALGITAYNGVSLSWSHELSDALTALVTPYIGFKDKNKVHYNEQTDFEFEAKSVMGFDVNLFGDGSRWHFSYVQANYNQVLTLYNVNQPLPAGGSIIIPQVAIPSDDQSITLWSLGTQYEFGQSKLTIEGQMNDLSSSFYIMGEHHFRMFTPYLTYGMELSSSEHKESDSYLIGARVNVLDNVSLNLEWQYFEVYKGNGPFMTLDVIPQDRTAQLYTVMLSFVF